MNLTRVTHTLRSTALAAVISFLTLCALPASAVPASAASVTVGNNDSGNCYPFSCLASDVNNTGSRYQQVYSSTAFSGAININSISFFLSEGQGGLMDSASYAISFSTTSAAVGALDTTFANNVGGDSQAFGTFAVSGAMPSVLSFTGTSFAYNPSMGNLLMNVDVFGLTASNGYQSFFQADFTGVKTSRLYGYNGSLTSDNSFDQTGALRTGFNVSAVPEPETYAMMLAGLGLLGFAARRRKQKAA